MDHNFLPHQFKITICTFLDLQALRYIHDVVLPVRKYTLLDSCLWHGLFFLGFFGRRLNSRRMLSLLE
jgi:hypothetical protein